MVSFSFYSNCAILHIKYLEYMVLFQSYLYLQLGKGINILFYGITKGTKLLSSFILMNDIYFEDQLLFSRLHIKYELIQDVLICKTIEASEYRKENSLHISPSWLICFSFCLNLQHFVFIQTGMNTV